MLKLLDEAWEDEKTNVFALVAGGGVGKSALVNYWLATMGQDDYRGARRVYGHSFYSQGTSDGTASADKFFAEALAWFGDPDPKKGSAWARGERLAELVRAERTLLILDGMEPLQFPPGPSAGRVTDPGLQALIRELAARNPGLCVVTTREHVADLDRFAGAGATQKNLEELPNEAGANLLVQLGATGPVAEMKEASKEFRNHALALTLLGTYLVKARGRDIRRRTEISLVDADKMQGGHARKVMESYEKWFSENERWAELSILRMLGLFNRPAEVGCIAALRGGEPIADLTAGLADISEDDWNIALANLREVGLLAKVDVEAPDTLDAHPLVREHFGKRLRKDYPEARRAGHERLYEYLKGPGCEKDLPDTAEEMAPLYAAVLHGCAAQKHSTTLRDVFQARVRRGDAHYSLFRLGLVMSDLVALTHFFREEDRGKLHPDLSGTGTLSTWKKRAGWLNATHPDTAPDLPRPLAILTMLDQAYVLNEVGSAMRFMGFPLQAIPYITEGHKKRSQESEPVLVGRSARNLSKVYLQAGMLEEATKKAREAVDCAQADRGSIELFIAYANLGRVLHCRGEVEEARAAFEESQKYHDVKKGFTLQEAHYCELLLEQEQMDAAVKLLRYSEPDPVADVLNHGLYHGTYGRVCVTQGTQVRAIKHLDLAMESLEGALRHDELGATCLIRAALHRENGDRALAEKVCETAASIALRGGLKLLLIDCYIEACMCELIWSKDGSALESLEEFSSVSASMGYSRREPAFDLLRSGGGPRS